MRERLPMFVYCSKLGGIALQDAEVIQERSLLDMWMRRAKNSSSPLSPSAISEFVPPTCTCLTQAGVSPGTKCRKGLCEKSGGIALQVAE